MASNLLDPFGLLSSSMPAYQNPANAAMPYLQQIPGTISPYYQPYINTGNQAMQDFFKQIQQLATPGGATDIYNQVASGYTTSPGTQSAINNATKQTNQVAAATGMFGTPSEQTAVASETEALSFKDFNEYMSQALGLYGEGLKGEEGLTELGYKASSELASDLAKNLMSDAGLSFAGVQGQNKYNAVASQNSAQLIGALLGIAAKAAMA
jgi:hypothetical protein